MRTSRRVLIAIAAGALLAGTGVGAAAAAAPAAAHAPALVPQPSSVHTAAGSFTLDHGSRIVLSSRAYGVGAYLAGVLRPSTRYPLAITTSGAARHDIALVLGGPSALGSEGYTLDATTAGLRLRARTTEGLFHGAQTLRQLLPARVEARTAQPGPWTVAGVHITDHPRFPWRGAMLDVSRHFFGVQDVERYIDLLAAYKINVLHLHLSDDQGWRIAITGWPRLTSYGGSTEVGGGAGGYYTQAQYRAIVHYAVAHFVTVVPEIDSPSHSNAALASYAALNCDGKAPPLYTGTDVGFSSFCVHKEITYRFLSDVIGQLAAMTPGRYLHLGGDEAHSTSAADYAYFVHRVQQIVTAHGKTLIGWHQIGSADISAGSLAQYWGLAGSEPDIALAQQARAQGAKLVMSPADKDYLDQKYDPSTPLGLSWAGYNSVSDSYDWNPATYVPGIGEKDIRGVEAPLWSETLTTLRDIEYMAFPRLPGIAEIGWSPQSTHSWANYRVRLAAQAPRWELLGVNYFRSPDVPWPG